MTIKQLIKRSLKILFAKRPVYVTAQITQLGQSELLKGRGALITGGTSGIGYAIADAMLNAGASVVITGRSEERLKMAVEKLSAVSLDRKNRVYGMQMDNSNTQSFKPSFESIEKQNQNSGISISILVNNAGVQGAQFGTALEEEYDAVLDTNLKGAFFLSQIVAHYMKNNQIQGNILNIGSSSSVRPASSAYTISKWGIRGITLGMAKSLIPYGIVVNGIAPGPTATPMLGKQDNDNIFHSTSPLGRYATAEEIANMAVLLTSGIGRTIVGDMIFMTGGAGILTYDDMPYPFE